MTVVGVSMFRDEEDIAESTVRNMLRQVDHCIVADNRSSDGSRRILEELRAEYDGYGQQLIIVDDPEVGHYQSVKITALAHRAHNELDATWIVPFDFDEMWYSSFGRIADVLAASPDPATPTAHAVLYDHVPTAEDDPEVEDPVSRIVWRRPKASGLPKIVCRWHPDLRIDDGNHRAFHADDVLDYGPALLVIRHFPYRSQEQFARKAMNGAEALAATDLPESVGTHWRAYGHLIAEGGIQAGYDWFHEHFWSADPTDDQLVFDPARAAAEAGLVAGNPVKP